MFEIFKSLINLIKKRLMIIFYRKNSEVHIVARFSRWDFVMTVSITADNELSSLWPRDWWPLSHLYGKHEGKFCLEMSRVWRFFNRFGRLVLMCKIFISVIRLSVSWLSSGKVREPVEYLWEKSPDTAVLGAMKAIKSGMPSWWKHPWISWKGDDKWKEVNSSSMTK